MARPLPNTNAPASAKYQVIHNVAELAGPCSPLTHHASHGATDNGRQARRNCGPVRTSGTTKPHSRKIQTISDSVQAVTMALTANSSHRSQSCDKVMRVSLTALRAIIAITAAPMP